MNEDVTQLGIMVVASLDSRRALLTRMLREIGAGRGWSLTSLSTLSVDKFGSSRASLLVADLASYQAALQFLQTVKELPGGSGTVALVDDPDPRWVRHAMHAGVNALIARDADKDQLALAVEAADTGYVLLHPASARMLGDPTPVFDDQPETMEPLTTREREVLGWISGGLGNKEIAARLGISEHTVKFHASSILAKLGAASRTEAVSQGIKRGLITL